MVKKVLRKKEAVKKAKKKRIHKGPHAEGDVDCD